MGNTCQSLGIDIKINTSPPPSKAQPMRMPSSSSAPKKPSVASTLVHSNKHKFKGHWKQGASNGSMETYLRFDGNKSITGDGSDKIGKFIFTGSVDGNDNIQLIKKYIGKHNVNYKGKVVKENGEILIKGQWNINASNKGSFELKKVIEEIVIAEIKKPEKILEKGELIPINEDVVKYQFKGYWEQGTSKGDMDTILEFHKDSKITGTGNDKVGKFVWNGSIDKDEQVSMKKQYIGKHAVTYNGKFVREKEKLVIFGKWTISASSKGGFRLVKGTKIASEPTKEVKKILKDGELIPINEDVAKYQFKGYWEQGSSKGDMDTILEFHKDSKITGEGNDKVGKFTWNGEISENEEVLMKKQYIGKHAVEYQGKFVREKEKLFIFGKWTISSSSKGGFRLEKGEKVANIKKILQPGEIIPIEKDEIAFKFKGNWTQGANKGDLDADLVFHKDSIITGNGTGNLGAFTWKGKVDENENVEFTKEGDNVTACLYSGKFVRENESLFIIGEWKVSEGNKGQFKIEKGEMIAAESQSQEYVYKGYYMQGNKKGDMDCTLTFADALISGEGSDGVGKFEWKGSIEEGNKVKLTKQYIGKHSIAYEGDIDEEKKKIEGEWKGDFGGINTGKFLLEIV